MSDYKPYLALALIVFSIGVIFLAPGQTGYLVTSDGGGGGTSDTIKPTVSVSAPSSATAGTSVAISATASDNLQVAKIEIFVDNYLKKTCSIYASSGSCYYSTSLTAGTHSYYAKATDSKYNAAITAAKSIAISAPQLSPITISGGSGSTPRTIDLLKEYVGYDLITFKGALGGEGCNAKIQMNAYNNAGGLVAQGTSESVNVHIATGGSIPLQYTSGIRRIQISTVSAGGWFTCDKFDSSEATVAVDKIGPQVSAMKIYVNGNLASAGYANTNTNNRITRYEVEAVATDPNGVSKIELTVGSNPTQTCYSSSCKLGSSTIPTGNTEYPIKVVSYDNSRAQNSNTYNTRMKIGHFYACVASACN